MMNIASKGGAEPLRVLVIDDDELDRFVIRRSFNVLGTPVDLIEVDDPRHAMDAIVELKPDITLLDIQMPRMSGFDVLEALLVHQSKPETLQRIMMLSSSTRDHDRKRALSLGVTDFRTKPSTLDDYIRLAEDIHATYYNNH